nr:NlpC/P60 family protein [Rubellimicrobium sp. CFH 75288]
MTPFSGRVAATHLRGLVAAERFADGEARRVAAPVLDLRSAPGGPRARQLLWGEGVTLYERREAHAFVQSHRDGHVGWVRAEALAEPRPPTHRVAVPATHLYAAEDIKSPDLHHLSLGSLVTVTAERHRFWETPEGFIPKPHLRPLDRPFADAAAVAQLLFGVPYLWGGNSVRGIDCSGLVQAALLATGLPCPPDSDLQRGLGEPVADGAPLRRGDLVFWPGHVGLMVDEGTLLHANAHRMAVAYEPLEAAIARIRAQEGHDPIARRRI